ncbi:hypothetical protein BKA70DRAFT_1441555 [Coprinopsis sp. MPI-PUGE-AT-0042]|nr:hypothetical protein BKA70DRAFT_1441555 [Coprinopsis sp. MPI-PUGE-AT-0042]
MSDDNRQPEAPQNNTGNLNEIPGEIERPYGSQSPLRSLTPNSAPGSYPGSRSNSAQRAQRTLPNPQGRPMGPSPQGTPAPQHIHNRQFTQLTSLGSFSTTASPFRPDINRSRDSAQSEGPPAYEEFCETNDLDSGGSSSSLVQTTTRSGRVEEHGVLNGVTVRAGIQNLHAGSSTNPNTPIEPLSASPSAARSLPSLPAAQTIGQGHQRTLNTPTQSLTPGTPSSSGKITIPRALSFTIIDAFLDCQIVPPMGAKFYTLSSTMPHSPEHCYVGFASDCCIPECPREYHVRALIRQGSGRYSIPNHDNISVVREEIADLTPITAYRTVRLENICAYIVPDGNATIFVAGESCVNFFRDPEDSATSTTTDPVVTSSASVEHSHHTGHPMRPYFQVGSQPASPDEQEIIQLRQQVASLKVDLRETRRKMHRECAKMAALHLEVLQTRLAADGEFKLKVDSTVMHLRSLLEDTEKELEFYKDGTRELQSSLGKSMRSNAALITFIHQILVDRVYPRECDWGNLKATED